MKANELKDKSIEQLNSDLLDLLKSSVWLTHAKCNRSVG